MDVVVELGDPISLTVTDVHPVALPDAIDLAVAAALRLQRELAKLDPSE